MEKSEICAKNGNYGESFNGLFILLFLFLHIQNDLYKKGVEKNENKIYLRKRFFQIKILWEGALPTLVGT